MKSSLIACILLTYVSRSFEFNLQSDLELNGMVLQPFKRIHVQTNGQFLTYRFDVSRLEYIGEHGDFIKSLCPQRISVLENYNFDLEMKWKKQIPIKRRGLSVTFVPKSISNLEDKIGMLTVSNCDTIGEVVMETYTINDRLNELAGSNFDLSTILYQLR